MANISFGERIRRARVRNAMTQAELAEKMGVSQAAISTWEIGKIVPDVEQKKELKSILGLVEVDSGDKVQSEVSESGPRSPIGAWVNQMRLEKKMSVGELATAAELSVPAIYNIESGKIANPRAETRERLEKALGAKLPLEVKNEVREESTIAGVGELTDFDPHDDDDLPNVPGIYALYDISERPIYVGQGTNIANRIRSHDEKFWFKQPIVETGAYVRIEDKDLREKVEKLLIRFLKSNAVINVKNADR